MYHIDDFSLHRLSFAMQNITTANVVGFAFVQQKVEFILEICFPKQNLTQLLLLLLKYIAKIIFFRLTDGETGFMHLHHHVVALPATASMSI